MLINIKYYSAVFMYHVLGPWWPCLDELFSAFSSTAWFLHFEKLLWFFPSLHPTWEKGWKDEKAVGSWGIMNTNYKSIQPQTCSHWTDVTGVHKCCILRWKVRVAYRLRNKANAMKSRNYPLFAMRLDRGAPLSRSYYAFTSGEE